MDYFKINDFFEMNMTKDYYSNKMKYITSCETIFLEKIFLDRDAKILDIMCGYGRLANSLIDKGFSKIDGIDMSDYSFIPEVKKFNFIKDDFYKWDTDKKYDYCYSLYNSYPTFEKFLDTIDCSKDKLKKNGILVIDIFSKEWRDNVEGKDYKKVLDNEEVLVELFRKYDGEYETTEYKIYLKKSGQTLKHKYSQCVVSKEKLLLSISNHWDVEIMNSQEVGTREDNQKHILVLRRK